MDLTGSVDASGWLATVTDPTGAFVAFGYDRAGNVVRSWDRNATVGTDPGDYPGAIGSPPAAFTETRFGAGGAVAAFEAPWRWPVPEVDQLGHATVTTRDASEVEIGDLTEPVRLLVVGAVSLSRRGTPGVPGLLSDGRRTSDVLLDSRIGDMLDRDDPPPAYVTARVHPANAPCQRFLRRRGLELLPGVVTSPGS